MPRIHSTLAGATDYDYGSFLEKSVDFANSTTFGVRRCSIRPGACPSSALSWATPCWGGLDKLKSGIV